MLQRTRFPVTQLLAFACACLGLAGTAVFAAPPAGKVLVDRGTTLSLAGARLLEDYGAFALFEVPASTLAAAAGLPGVAILDETIRFDAQPFRPGWDRIASPAGFEPVANAEPGLQLVQFIGPVRESWLGALRALGARPVHSVANQGYLVWADAAARQGLDAMADAGSVLQFSDRLPPWFKLGPSLRARFAPKGSAPEASEVVPVVIQMVRHDDAAGAQAEIERLTVRRHSAWTPILEYQNLVAEVRLSDIVALARRGDVVHVGEQLPRELFDEVQNQIVAGNFDAGQTGPSGPGYLPFLSGLGFSTNPADYPVVDVTDDGIGGNTAPTVPNNPTNDPTLDSRVLYRISCHGSNPNDGRSPDGHGHINASIVGGLDTRSGAPFQDPDGFQRGLGINPWARIGGTRIFGGNYNVSLCGNTDTGVILASYTAGARISSNSWGCSGCAGSYDDSSQAYDVGTRDADLATPGNQELITLFAAGNSGPGAATVGTPGNGKNMITVGASESDRPTWTDGCAVGPTGADNAMDVIGFSSRGPSPGSRKKPEVIAPGTHIQGTASTHPSYNGSGVCDMFQPVGQTVFAASSGTSHSTPAVAGVASLVYHWLENGMAASGPGSAPSPAMMKAYLMAHPTYLTGVSANDTLPSNSQGYGMPTLNLLFDDAQKFLLDQSEVFDNTGESWTWLGAVADPSKPVRIALAYTDQAGAIGTSPQVNNLNLAAEVDGSTYLGNVFSGRWSVTGGSADPFNNYEAVFLPAGTSGAISITVTAANIAGDGVPGSGDGTDQDFALVCYNCIQEPTFTLTSTPPAQAICTPADAQYALTLTDILGFSESVTLSALGHPAGTTTQFSANPVVPPGASTLTIGNTGAAAPGPYTITVTGTAVSRTVNRNVALEVFTAAPLAPGLLAPADGAIDLPRNPTLSWSAVAQAASYLVEVATDAGFGAIVRSATVSGTSWEVAPGLGIDTEYFWRVTATNICGQQTSVVFDFRTANPSVLLVDDDDNAPNVQDRYQAPLNSLAVYDVWDVAVQGGEPTLDDLRPYRSVVWFSGDKFASTSNPQAGPQAASELALALYLRNGRCLFLSSQDYAWDMLGSGTRPANAFMAEYLGFSQVASDSGDYTRVDGENVYSAYQDLTLTYAGLFSDFSDTLTLGSGQTAFRGDLPAGNTNLGATSKLGSTYFTTFLSFPLEAMTEPNRVALLQRFFDTCQAEVPMFADGFESGDSCAWSTGTAAACP